MSSSVPAADQGPEELDAALLQLERRALGRNGVPLVELPLARVLEHHTRQNLYLLARLSAQELAEGHSLEDQIRGGSAMRPGCSALIRIGSPSLMATPTRRVGIKGRW